ncbi:ABC transporter substrate-binding protein [Anaeromyxobacter paludicola]|uniref:ABC transporter substrate-binding protein n=1 Tax=Anaeromyxobacter paludicola TaxID=2918171 RepID=A0ABN6N7I6_9BACT|nr:ABC transporter substrate-binding protein [Anaeromyxobacter paludicola]BDG09154.1 ABC transporter substrate-binding protein [Anaeromyxobacter paludicola]
MHPLALTLALLAAAGGEVKIGVFSPFTGGSAGMGLSMRNGVRLAADEINAKGGILGKKVVLVERDDEAKNEKGGQILQELINREHVAAILGPTNTGVGDASTRYAEQAKIPMIVNVSAGTRVNELFPQYPDNYVFRLAAGDVVQSDMIVKEALDARHFKKPALLCDDTNYGQNGRAKMEKALEKRGVKPVYVGKFKIKDTDMTPQLQEARAAGADVILAYGIGPELAAVANSMERIGWKTDLIGSWTLSMAAFINNAGQNGNGATMPQTFIEAGATSGKAKQFVDAYHKKFNESPISVAVAAAQGYDSLYLLKLAMEQAGSTDGPKVKAALENLKAPYDGVTGHYAPPFTPQDHEAVKEANVVMGVVKGGKVVPPGATAKK